MGDVDEITKEILKKFREEETVQNLKTYLFWQWKTPQEMADYFIAKRTESLTGLEKRIKEEVDQLTSNKLMTTAEAPLHIADPIFKDRAEELLKSKIPDPKFPDSKESLIEFISDLLINDEGYHRMLNYYIKEKEKLKEVIEYGDSDNGLYTLHSTDNHYADMTKYTKGKKTFYFWIDRHY